jgi:hypothetical protein
MSRDGGRAKLAYDWYGSWTTLYSLYADAILCFHPTFADNSSSLPNRTPGTQTPLLGTVPGSNDFIPDHIYKTQSDWYMTAMQKYGVRLAFTPTHLTLIIADTFLATPGLPPPVHKVRLGVSGRCCRV